MAKKCRITVIRKVNHTDLSEKYENPIENACCHEEGEVFIANGWEKPEGLCQSAWDSMSSFVMALAHGGSGLYNGWMKDPRSAMISTILRSSSSSVHMAALLATSSSVP